MLSASTVIPSSTQALEVDCVNHWVNPQTRLVQCFDHQLNYVSVPANYFQQINSQTTALNSDSSPVLRRRATAPIFESSDMTAMIMPDLVGSEIDAAEDLLLSMGVTLGSEEVYGQDKAAGEITQQSPMPGTKLVKGQTVLL
ncbi:MAG: PASTA domain-containing protein, partial [Cyanobacteria bacterium J06623_7]